MEASLKSKLNPINYLRAGTVYQRRAALLLLLLSRLPWVIYRVFFHITLLPSRRKYSQYISLLKNQGFVHIPRGTLLIDDILAEIDSFIDAKSADNSTDLYAKKSYLIPLVDDNDDYSSLSTLVEFAASKEIVSIVSAYLYSLPILTYLNLWYSPKRNADKPEGSQLWHLDHESHRQVKIFLYIRDVDEDSGALKIFPKGYTLQKQKDLGYRVDAEHKHFSDGLDESIAKTLTGKRGDIMIADTCTCFHRGAYTTNSPRYVCTFQYLPVYAFSKNKFSKLKKLSSYAKSIYQKHLFYS